MLPEYKILSVLSPEDSNYQKDEITMLSTKEWRFMYKASVANLNTIYFKDEYGIPMLSTEDCRIVRIFLVKKEKKSKWSMNTHFWL